MVCECVCERVRERERERVPLCVDESVHEDQDLWYFVSSPEHSVQTRTLVAVLRLLVAPSTLQ